MDGGHASEISYSSSFVFKVKLVGTNNQKQFKEVFAMPKGRNAKKKGKQDQTGSLRSSC